MKDLDKLYLIHPLFDRLSHDTAAALKARPYAWTREQAGFKPTDPTCSCTLWQPLISHKQRGFNVSVGVCYNASYLASRLARTIKPEWHLTLKLASPLNRLFTERTQCTSNISPLPEHHASEELAVFLVYRKAERFIQGNKRHVVSRLSCTCS